MPSIPRVAAVALGAGLTLAASAHANPLLLDFEDLTLTDGMLVTSPAFVAYAAARGVSIVPGVANAVDNTVIVETYGGFNGPAEPDTIENREGFVCDNCSPIGFDRVRPGDPNLLQTRFLTAPGLDAPVNGGVNPPLGQAAPIFTIQYLVAPQMTISGQIWDIDGGPNIGTERYQIVARRSNGTVIETIVSPLGSGDGPASLDARPWTFTFDGIVGTNGAPYLISDIASIDINFTGSKTSGRGVAFDNFSTGVPVPEPATLALLAGGLLGIPRLRARRR